MYDGGGGRGQCAFSVVIRERCCVAWSVLPVRDSKDGDWFVVYSVPCLNKRSLRKNMYPPLCMFLCACLFLALSLSFSRAHFVCAQPTNESTKKKK